MERVQFLEHRGRRVLAVNLSGLREAGDLQAVTDAASRALQAEPPGSVLVLVDLAGVLYTLRTIRALGEVAARNARFVAARAVVGVPEIAMPAMRAVAVFSGRPAKAFSDRSTALDWLVDQDQAPAGA